MLLKNLSGSFSTTMVSTLFQNCDLNVAEYISFFPKINMSCFAEAVCLLQVADGFMIPAGEKGSGRTTKKPLHLKDTIFHRIIPGFMAQVILIEGFFFHS